VRTYLYVDGENFAIRARRLDERFRKAPELVEQHRQRFTRAQTSFDYFDAHNSVQIWAPPTTRDVSDNAAPLTANGIVHQRDEVYWDCVGLYIALRATMPGSSLSLATIALDRATYYATTSHDRIDDTRRLVHALGFSPHVFKRMRPDDHARAMAAEGITVVSRPKPLDILLATQVLEDASSNNFDRCILVASDADYVPLIEAVRRRGKQVWIVAIDAFVSAQSDLRIAGDRYVPWDPVLAVRPLPIAG